MANQQLNVFISYGRKDGRELAIRLRDDLQSAGCSVWLDLNEIVGGGDWSQQIEDAIEHCNVALALMSPASNESQWCRAEQLRALRKGKRVIPIRVTRDADPPLHLEHLNHLDFTDADRYAGMFRDLLSDITAGQAFQPAREILAVTGGDSSPYKRRSAAAALNDEKRNAPAFRRHLKALRKENWLGARFWWPYFLFHFTDMTQLVDVLTADVLASQVGQGGVFNTRWDKFVRLYFRPRTPDLYFAEGFRPIGLVPQSGYMPVPVYLLFDLEAVITQDESRFSDGNPEKTGKTYKTPAFFRELPFEQIYHDSWFLPDEREEIMRCREAQVTIPDAIGLESLQLIWVRSEAEYETLRTLLPPELWARWRSKITPRTDYHLFNNRHIYVQTASLLPDEVRLRFNPCQTSDACGPFSARLTVTGEGGVYTWESDQFDATRDLVVSLPDGIGGYDMRFWLDDDLAYAGRMTPTDVLL